jgi:hypothetical protein
VFSFKWQACYNAGMLRWPWLHLWLALTVAWLLTACGLPPTGLPATPLPAPLASSTSPRLTLTAAPSATAFAVFTVTQPPATLPLSPSPWPTVQTATPIFLPDVDATSTAQAVSTLPVVLPPTLPPAPATQVAATVPPAASSVPPSIAAFSITPAEIQPGQPVTLTWQAAGEQVTIQRLDALGRIGDFYTVGLSGSLRLSTPPEQRGEVQFMLFATTGSASVQAVARARILCPDTWFFPNPPPECPASPPHSTAMQAQAFERGQMLWTQYDDRIYVLYTDGVQPAWDTLLNAWFPGQPESDPTLTPPPGFFQPVRGFGVAWRTGYVSPVQVVRDRLGWATGAEFGVPNAHVQCDSSPKYGRCYLSGPGGVVYVLQPERSGWALWGE